MFDNWLKNFDVLDYKTVKNNFVEYNLKVKKFWTDFFEDVFSDKKK